MLLNSEDYQRYAQECLRWAVRAQDEQLRYGYLRLAATWTRVALTASGSRESKTPRDQHAA